MDSLLKGRSLFQFEQSIGMIEAHYLDSALSRTVHAHYQSFTDSIHHALHEKKWPSNSEIEVAYNALIKKLQPIVNGAKPLPPPLPIPESTNCDIIGFENGDFVGWELFRGNVTGATPFSFDSPYAVTPGLFHSIQTGGTDPVTGIPRVDPTGGTYSVLLGDETGNGAEAAQLKHSFVVDANTVLFEYSYAVVFQSPLSHNANELPYFTVRMFDELGNTIPCGNFSVYADQATAADFDLISGTGVNVLYKDWTKVITNLTAYMGQNVTIEFTSGDCSLGAHYGYAYVDASCGIDTISATQDTICPGEFTTITAPLGASTYFWGTGGGGVTGQSITVDSGGVYTCYMTPFQGAACYFTMDYIIIEKIGPEAAFISLQDTVCLNDPITFQDQSTITVPEAISGYSWDFGDGVTTGYGTGVISGIAGTSGSFSNPTHVYDVDGTFLVQLTISSSTGCDNSFIDTVVVQDIPTVNAGVDSLYCDSTILTLSGTGANSYIWDQGVTDGVPFVQSAGNIVTYTVIGTDLYGCENTDQVTIETTVLPIVDAGLDQIVCEGAQVALSANGAVSYSWNNGIVNQVPFVQAVGQVNYTVTGTDANGCQNSDQVTVTVNPLPIVNAGSDQTVCEGTSIVLNGSGSGTPSWANGFSTGAPFTPPVGNNIYVLSDTLTTGCFAVDSTVVVVLPNPIVTSVDTAVCFGESVTLFGQGALNYSWTENITNGVPFTPGQTTSYTVTGTDANGCQNSATVVVTVYPNPNASFTLVDSIMTAESAFTTFNNYSTGATTYEWDFGDGSDINTAFEPIHYFPNESSIYYEITLVAISDQGCIDSTSQTGLVYAEQTIYVPNAFTPDDDEFNQVFLPILNGFDESNYVLFIYNRWGELIFESYDVNVGWDGTYGNQGIAVQDGTYTWKIQLGVKESSEIKEFLGHVIILK
ncbi:MAG: hypothetical protein Crog4KO_34520 [Crocinitomicaceae bacterium]